MRRSRRIAALGAASSSDLGADDSPPDISLDQVEADSRNDFDDSYHNDKDPSSKVRRRARWSPRARRKWYLQRLQLERLKEGTQYQYFMVISCLFLAAVALMFVRHLQTTNDPSHRLKKIPILEPTASINSWSVAPLSIPAFLFSSGRAPPFYRPPPLPRNEHDERPDRGGLIIRFPLHTDDITTLNNLKEPDPPPPRRYLYRDEYDPALDTVNTLFQDDDFDYYYGFDDDYVRSPYTRYNDDDTAKNLRNERTCRRNNWHRLLFPTCNTLHEMDIATDNIPKYLSHGGYREVFVVQPSSMEEESIIWKQLLYKFTPTDEYFEYIRMDALVSERLTKHKNIVDIYGHCGNSVLSEYVAHGKLEDQLMIYDLEEMVSKVQERDEVVPLNNIPVDEKLDIALQMAESLALLHGYPGGLIMHDDVSPEQFLIAKDGSVKLNDFNRAEAMLWDDENEEYCKFFNGVGNGVYRSPEEYFDSPVDEKIDIYSLGNIFYTLLTGLHPFYDSPDEEDMQRRVKSRDETPLGDDDADAFKERSSAEAKLVRVTQACLKFDRDERPTIFEVVEFLRRAVQKEAAAK